MKKITKNTKGKKVKPKKENLSKYVYDDYLCIRSFKRKPVGDRFIEILATDLVEWATQDEDALKLTQFIISRGIAIQDFYRWLHKHQILKEAHATAMLALGNRREIGALTKKYDASMVKSIMPVYDPEWRKEEEWRQSLKKDEDKRSVTLNLVMEKFTDEDVREGN